MCIFNKLNYFSGVIEIFKSLCMTALFIQAHISKLSTRMLKQIKSAVLTGLSISSYTAIYNQDIDPRVLIFSAFWSDDYRIIKCVDCHSIKCSIAIY